MRRAALVHERLVLLGVAFKWLLGDQTFVVQLRAQKLYTMPEVLKVSLKGPDAKG